MKSSTKIWLPIGIVLIILLVMIGAKYNTLVTEQENTKQSWSQVENVYQRRLDLIPNLVATVKAYAKHEKDTFVQVTEARAKASGTIGMSALQDPSKFQQFQQAQSELSSALSRLMVVVERYPDLKASQNFLTLQSQLEGTENRIAVERRRYNEASQTYNTELRIFPGNLIAKVFGFTAVQYFQAEQGAAAAPKVEF